MAECTASTTASLGSPDGSYEKVLETPGELSALREEIAEMRKWTQSQLEREMQERQKEAKYVQNAVNILAQRSDAEIKARFKLAEHVQELIGEAKRNVEAVCTECGKQQDSIKDLWGSVNMLSIMLRRDQHPLIRVQEWIMEAKRHTEKVRAECQKHEKVTQGLGGALQQVVNEFGLDKPEEETVDSAERMDWLSKSAKQRLESVLAEYEAQLVATHELLNSITSLRAIIDKEPPEKVIGARDMDQAFLNFMAVVVERDAADGSKGLVKAMGSLSEATKCGSFQSDEQAEEWLTGARTNLQEACRECEMQKQATLALMNAIVKAKELLNAQLQERIRLHDSGRPKWSAPDQSPSQTPTPPPPPPPPPPKEQNVNWQVAIEDMMKRRDTAPSGGDEVYQADNSILQASTPGLGFRNTPNLEDMDKEKVLVPWSSLVCGVSHNEHWLKVGERYLPKFLRNIQVLRPYQEPPNSTLGAMPIDCASSPRKASAAPNLQPIPESPTREASEDDDRQNSEFALPRTLSADSIGTESTDSQSQADQQSVKEEPQSPKTPQKPEPQTEFQAGTGGQPTTQAGTGGQPTTELSAVPELFEKQKEEMREFVTKTVKSAFETLEDQLRHEAARALENLQKESSLTSITLQSNLKGDIEGLREQIPNEIQQCFAKNKLAMVEQAAELKKSVPLLLDEKVRSEIEELAHKVFKERSALAKLRPDRSLSPCLAARPGEAHSNSALVQNQQFWGLVNQLKASGDSEEQLPSAELHRNSVSHRNPKEAAVPEGSEILNRSATDTSITEVPPVSLAEAMRRSLSPGPGRAPPVVAATWSQQRGRNTAGPLVSRTVGHSPSAAMRRSASTEMNIRTERGQGSSTTSPAVSRGVSPIPSAPSSTRGSCTAAATPIATTTATVAATATPCKSGPPVSQAPPALANTTPLSAHLYGRRSGPSSSSNRMPESPRTTPRGVRHVSGAPGTSTLSSGAPGTSTISPGSSLTAAPRRELASPAGTSRRVGQSLDGSYKSVVSAVSTALSSGHSERSLDTVKSVVSV